MFESCSAYHPDILFISHCVPNPPDKGERIRAFHELNNLVKHYRVHLVCFARSDTEMESALELKDRCFSGYVEQLPSEVAALKAVIGFLSRRSLSLSFYRSRHMQQYVRSIAKRVKFVATVVYSSAMYQYAPDGIPPLLDMVDVDSEKWLQYGAQRRIGLPYRLEGENLRKAETNFAEHAKCTLLSTQNELRLFQRFAPQQTATYMENGVDFVYYDPFIDMVPSELRGRRFALFVGAMDYFPNIDAVRWFAENVFPELRCRHPGYEFLIVGRHPVASVKRLASQPGVTVTGAVRDIRPYLAAAQAAVAPFRIARGIQNKVLEALAMGKRALVSSAIATTFGESLPAGVIVCKSVEDYLRELDCVKTNTPAQPIRDAAKYRFSWERNLKILTRELQRITDGDTAPQCELRTTSTFERSGKQRV